MLLIPDARHNVVGTGTANFIRLSFPGKIHRTVSFRNVLQDITVVDLRLIPCSKSLIVFIQYRVWPDTNAAVFQSILLWFYKRALVPLLSPKAVR